MMNANKFLLAVAMVAGMTMAARAEADIEAVSLKAEDGLATISYHLGAEPKIVTMGIELQDEGGVWNPLPEQQVTTVWGDVNKLVTNVNADCSITWAVDVDLLNKTVETGKARAVLTAWATNAPPDYMVVELGGQSPVRGVWYYTSTNALPYGGLANDLYRTKRMILRKIPAKGVTYTMGGDNAVDPDYGIGINPGWDDGQDVRYAGQKPHRVTLTRDFYIGVYEVTKAQWSLVRGDRFEWDPGWTEVSYTNTTPAWGWWIGEFRGNAPTYNWPATGYAVDPDSFVGRLRSSTGLLFEYPTEAEWEYACRAGNPYAYNVGDNTIPGMERRNRSAWAFEDACRPVGQKEPNAWGLYDMIGNVQEMCLDAVANNDWVLGDAVDPIGYEDVTDGSAILRVARGGSYATYSWAWSYGGLTCASRTNCNFGGAGMGARVVVPLELHVFSNK